MKISANYKVNEDLCKIVIPKNNQLKTQLNS